MESVEFIINVTVTVLLMCGIPFVAPIILRQYRYLRNLQPTEIKIISSEPRKVGRLFNPHIVFEYKRGEEWIRSCDVGYPGSTASQNYTAEIDAKRFCAKFTPGEIVSAGLRDLATERVILEPHFSHRITMFSLAVTLIIFLPIIWVYSTYSVITWLSVLL